MGGQMGGTGCGVRGGPRGTWAWVAPGRVITLCFNSRCVPEPSAEVSGACSSAVSVGLRIPPTGIFLAGGFAALPCHGWHHC